MEPSLELPFDEERKVFTVSQVNRIAREMLEQVTIWVEGEVTDVNTGYRYYTYFTLRDKQAALPVIMEKPLFNSLDFPLEEGGQVLAYGKLSLYEKRGNYQLRVMRLEPYGEGEMRRRIELLKRKLASEGLMADERKKPVPSFPEKIGIISSAEGAAVRDVIKTVVRRFPAVHLLVKDVRVQGGGASLEICEALEFFNDRLFVDVIVLARGGGSLQDLEPFNSEEVARAIAGSSIPVITGVGHEPDVTVADLVADWRASTPTGAGEAAVPERGELTLRLKGMSRLMRRRIYQLLEADAQQLTYLASRPVFSRSDFLISTDMQRLDQLTDGLRRAPARSLERMMERFQMALSRSAFARSETLFEGDRDRLDRVTAVMYSLVCRIIEDADGRVEYIKGKISALSPLAVLERGYAIAFPRGQKRALRSKDEVGLGDKIEVRLHRGRLHCEVEEKE